MNENYPITRSTLLSDVVNANPAILSVLERLDIRLGFHEATVKDICAEYGLSSALLISIFNIYACDSFEPQAKALTKQDVLKLIKYLETSHKYYSKKSFPSLHGKIHRLLKEGDQNNAKILNKFYDDYSQEMKHHFLFEENIVFPFMKEQAQIEWERPVPFDITLFAENHSNIEDKLSDLKNTFLKYLPHGYSPTLHTSILKDIYSLSEDLQKHTEIEDKLLIPAIDKLLNKADAQASEDSAKEETSDSNSLSDREKEIIAEVAKGLTNKEIADKLNISIHTVTTHRKNISRKTGINSISGITVYAIINKLVNLNDLKY